MACAHPPGRWKGTLVAIKVVEHAPVTGNGLSEEQQQVEREALLASNLAHPNIISTCAQKRLVHLLYIHFCRTKQ
jgi:hypothetical protein